MVDANTGFPVVNPDKQDIGTSQRDFSMGLINSFSYKNWQLSFSLDYRKGGSFYSSTADIFMFSGNAVATTYNDRNPFVVPNSVNQITGGDGKPVYIENKTVIAESVFDSYFYTNNNKAIATDAADRPLFPENEGYFDLLYFTCKMVYTFMRTT